MLTAVSRLTVVLAVVCALAVPAGSAGAAPFVRGDVNQSGALDISDAINVLLYLFGSAVTPETSAIRCLDAADVNDSGAIDLADAVYELAYLFAGGRPPAPPFPSCGYDPDDDPLTCDFFGGPQCPPYIRITGTTGCKQDEPGAFKTEANDCMEYEYDGEAILLLKHINAGFNCCPGEIIASVTIEDDLIAIAEDETEGLCACLCLFDVGLEVGPIPPGIYTIAVKEPYVGDDEPLLFVADLTEATSGRFCVPRTQYPW